MKVCASVDLDNYREYRSLVDAGDDGRERSFYGDAVPRFLDLFDRWDMRATFFVIGKDLDKHEHRRMVREIAARGHEVGNHSYSHPYNFRHLPRDVKATEIDRCEGELADTLGERPVGFRTPSCDVDGETLRLLEERGYLYDSSVFPTPVMWAFMLYGKLFVRRADYQLGELRAAFAPNAPYVPDPERIHRERIAAGNGATGIVEIPCSVLPIARVPFYSTLLRRLGPRAFSLMTRLYGRNRPVLHTLFHLIELADFDDTPLGAAYRRMPGLSVSIAERQRFLDHSIAEMAAAGQAVPLRDVAAAHVRRSRGAQAA